MIKVFFKSAYGLPDIVNASIDLVIIHYPYYNDDAVYVQTARTVLADSFRALKSGGVVAVIQHDLKKLGTPPRHMLLYQAAIRAGFNPYDQKIWYRQESTNLFRKNYANVSIFGKGRPKTAERSNDYINDVWHLPDSMIRDGYRDAFHSEIPKRLIITFTKEGETVLDPFLGSGTTFTVCEQTNRNGIGYEIEKELKKFYPATWEIIE